MTEETIANSTKFSLSDRQAFERTRLAYERTMMAWIRTATSLITFGFAVYKFFQFETHKAESTVKQGAVTPREFGLAMVGIAVFSLLLAGIGHRRNMQMLRAQGLVVPYSMSAILAGVIAMLGIVVLVAVWLRL